MCLTVHLPVSSPGDGLGRRVIWWGWGPPHLGIFTQKICVCGRSHYQSIGSLLTENVGQVGTEDEVLPERWKEYSFVDRFTPYVIP